MAVCVFVGKTENEDTAAAGSGNKTETVEDHRYVIAKIRSPSALNLNLCCLYCCFMSIINNPARLICSYELFLFPGFDHRLISLDELCEAICVTQSRSGSWSAVLDPLSGGLTEGSEWGRVKVRGML